MRGNAHVRFGQEKQANSSTTPCFLLHCRPGRGFCTWPSCWMCGPGVWWVGRWPITFAPRWCSMRSRSRLHNVAPNRSSIIRIAAASTPAMRSASVAARPASCPRWARPKTLTITRWPRVSLRHWSEKSLTVDASRLGPRHAWRSSPGWKVGTTRTGAIPHSAIGHPSITRGRCCQELLRSQALHRPRKRGKTRVAEVGLTVPSLAKASAHKWFSALRSRGVAGRDSCAKALG